MASIRREITVTADSDAAWDAARDVGAVHRRLAPGFVTHTVLEPGARIVTFANGMSVKELIVDLDETARRLVWSARSERLLHHNASLQIFHGDGGGTRIVWIADILPDEMKDTIAGMIDAGMAAIKAHLESADVPA